MDPVAYSRTFFPTVSMNTTVSNCTYVGVHVTDDTNKFIPQ